MDLMLLFLWSFCCASLLVAGGVLLGRGQPLGLAYLAASAATGWLVWRAWHRLREKARDREVQAEIGLAALADTVTRAARESAALRATRFRSDGNVAIHVPDLGKAEAFYGGVLGFRLVNRSAEHLEYDTGALHLWVNRDDAVQGFIPALAVPDYAAAKAHLEAAGCAIVREWPGGKALYFRDPFGLVVDIVETAPAKTPARTSVAAPSPSAAP